MPVMFEDRPIARRRAVECDPVANPFGDLVDLFIGLSGGNEATAGNLERLTRTAGFRHPLLDPFHHHVFQIRPRTKRMEAHAVTRLP